MSNEEGHLWARGGGTGIRILRVRGQLRLTLKQDGHRANYSYARERERERERKKEKRKERERRRKSVRREQREGTWTKMGPVMEMREPTDNGFRAGPPEFIILVPTAHGRRTMIQICFLYNKTLL